MWYIWMVTSASLIWSSGYVKGVDGNAVSLTAKSSEHSVAATASGPNAKVTASVSPAGAIEMTASVSEGTMTIVITYRCEGNLVKTYEECAILGDVMGCWYNTYRQDYDTCQKVCDGKRVDSVQDTEMCDFYCPGYRRAACEEYRHTTSSTTTTPTTTTPSPTTNTTPSSAAPIPLASAGYMATSAPKPVTSKSRAITYRIQSHSSSTLKSHLPVGPTKTKVTDRRSIVGGLMAIVVFLFFTIPLALFYLKCRQSNISCWWCKGKLDCCLCWCAENCCCRKYAISGLRKKPTVTPENIHVIMTNDQMSSTPPTPLRSAVASSHQLTTDSYDGYSTTIMNELLSGSQFSLDSVGQQHVPRTPAETVLSDASMNSSNSNVVYSTPVPPARSWSQSSLNFTDGDRATAAQ